MSHEELISEVADALGNDNIQEKITRWLNSTIDKLSARYLFEELHAEKDLSTVASTRTYALDAEFKFLKLVWIPGDRRIIYPINEGILAEMDASFSTGTGSIIRYVLHGKNISFYRVPDGVKAIKYTMQKRGAILSELTDYPDLPIEWHEVIAQGAIVRGFQSEDSNQYANALIAYKDAIKEAKKSSDYRPDRILVMGCAFSESYRPARPILPSNYPS